MKDFSQRPTRLEWAILAILILVVLTAIFARC